MDAGTFEGFSTTLEEPGILAVTFDRPETMNASTIGMKRDLVELLTRAQLDDAVRVLVFTGTGRAFWAGDDMKSYGNTAGSVMGPIGAGHDTPLGTYDALRAVSQAVNVAVRNLDKLTVAAINGFAIQTGFSFALVLRRAQVVVERDEVERGPDPDDSRDDVQPACEQVEPVGDVRIDR